MSILIRGGGIAANCCGYLLGRAGLEVNVQNTSRGRLPAIMLSDAAVALIRDVFGKPGALRNARHIRQRVVKWGEHTQPVSLPHSALVVSEEELLAAVAVPPAGTAGVTAQDWTIISSPPLPSESRDHQFGDRAASAARVQLAPECDEEACYIEAVSRGWLFLIPDAPAAGWLLSIGDPGQELLKESTLVTRNIASMDNIHAQFPASPRMLTPLCEPGWLACGSAAMAFDPICGDGTANAVREAILASAVTRAVLTGGDPAALLDHYQKRLTAGFYRHLAMCLDFYRTGADEPWWKEQETSTEHGLAWCGARLGGPPGFEYRLQGFDLVPSAR